MCTASRPVLLLGIVCYHRRSVVAQAGLRWMRNRSQQRTWRTWRVFKTPSPVLTICEPYDHSLLYTQTIRQVDGHSMSPNRWTHVTHTQQKDNEPEKGYNTHCLALHLWGQKDALWAFNTENCNTATCWTP